MKNQNLTEVEKDKMRCRACEKKSVKNNPSMIEYK